MPSLERLVEEGKFGEALHKLQNEYQQVSLKQIDPAEDIEDFYTIIYILKLKGEKSRPSKYFQASKKDGPSSYDHLILCR